jgi:3-hydroxyisobutyrate dehydrogenase
MGQSMCSHLIAKGFAVTVYNRSRNKAQPLIDRGAAWGATPRQVAQQSDVVFAIVGFPRDVREVFLGADGALAGSRPGTILVDMTTSEPSLAVEIYNAAKSKGVHAIDAPVSGGDVGAREARLSIMIGGDREVVEALQPCWEAMGKTIIHQGGPGAGQHTKMVNQTLIASNMIGVCEALLYAYKAGLDLPTVLQSVAPGAAGSWSLSNLGPRIIANNFDPGFFVEHFIKDMGIALDEANRMGLCLPGLALAKQLYVSLQAQGHGRDGRTAGRARCPDDGRWRNGMTNEFGMCRGRTASCACCRFSSPARSSLKVVQQPDRLIITAGDAPVTASSTPKSPGRTLPTCTRLADYRSRGIIRRARASIRPTTPRCTPASGWRSATWAAATFGGTRAAWSTSSLLRSRRSKTACSRSSIRPQAGC